MSEFIPIIAIIAVIILALGVLVAFIAIKRKKEGKYPEPDYRAFFIFGITILPVGIVFVAAVNPGFMGFIALGLIYMILGLSHRDKWKKS